MQSNGYTANTFLHTVTAAIVQRKAPEWPRAVATKKMNVIKGALQQMRHRNRTRCPRGMIPIRRSTVDDVLRTKSMVDFGKKQHRTLNITADLASIRIDAPDVVSGNGHETHVRTEGDDYTNA
ncbi:uncharacterized protein [Pyrus communis]|uniref:uncharacterized protein n=1 Tax=Pyrus communis TaxID=23211 RepID=UPI0035C0ECF6